MSVKIGCKLCGKQFKKKEFIIYSDWGRTIYGDYCRSCNRLRKKVIKEVINKIEDKFQIKPSSDWKKFKENRAVEE